MTNPVGFNGNIERIINSASDFVQRGTDALKEFGTSTFSTHADAENDVSSDTKNKRKKSLISVCACAACCAVTTCCCAVVGGIWSVLSCIAAPFIALFNLCKK